MVKLRENLKLKRIQGEHRYSRNISQPHPLCFCHKITENHIYCEKKPLIYYIHFANSILYFVAALFHTINARTVACLFPLI